MGLWYRLSTGAAVQLCGYWTPCPPGKSQTHELQTTGVSCVGAAEPEVSYVLYEMAVVGVG